MGDERRKISEENKELVERFINRSRSELGIIILKAGVEVIKKNHTEYELFQVLASLRLSILLKMQDDLIDYFEYSLSKDEAKEMLEKYSTILMDNFKKRI